MPLSVVGSGNATSRSASEGEEWNLSVPRARFWIYELPIRHCPVTPHFQERGRCGTCGTATAVKGSGFCGDECARTFMVNHNWDLARYAAMHHDDNTCARCGYQADASDRGRDLVVRHREIPRSGNVSLRGCHQHLSNLETLCRACGEPDRTDAQAPAVLLLQTSDRVEPAAVLLLETSDRVEPATTGEVALTPATSAMTALQAPRTTVKPHDLDAGLCRRPGTDPDFWFRPINRRAAQKTCESCPVRTVCARFALEMRVTDGVYAGVALPGRRHARKLQERRQILQQLVIAASDSVSADTEDDAETEMERAGA